MPRKAPAGNLGLPIPPKARAVLWSLVVADVMAVAWMLSAGDWLDRYSAVTAVVTLGGHHFLVMWLAVAGFAMLGGLALLTGGFAVAGRGHVPLLVLAELVSIVALAGLLAVLLLTVVVVGMVAVLAGAVVGRPTLFLGGLFRR